MKTYLVNQLARMAGISVRTLHHYDEIGLLTPAFVGENHYRYYGDEELLRLQQILVYRELDMPLGRIAAILDAPRFDRLKTLQKQREQLKDQATRYAEMIGTIDRTIAQLNGDCVMNDADLYSGIVSPEKQEKYEAWLVETYGPDMGVAIENSHKKIAEMTDDERADRMKRLETIEQGLAECFRQGVPPQAATLDALIDRHRAWVGASWAKECTPEAYASLAEAYKHPDFQARYESIQAGFADYLVTAMRSWAKRQN